MSRRRWTTRSMLTTISLACVLGIAGTAIAYDGRLDLATLDLEKARLLLEAADSEPQLDDKKEKEYSRLLQKAIKAIGDAESLIQDAGAVADSP